MRLRRRFRGFKKVQMVQRVVDCPVGNAYKVSVMGFPFPPSTVILSDSEGSRYVPLMRQMLLNTGRREGCRLAVKAA
jgi:hypothetical protein